MYYRRPFVTIEDLRAALRSETERIADVIGERAWEEIVSDAAAILWRRLGRNSHRAIGIGCRLIEARAAELIEDPLVI